MESLIRLMRNTAGSSVRAFIRWTDVFLLQSKGRRGWEFERAISFPVSHSLPFPYIRNETELDDYDDENSNKWNGFLWAAPKKRTTIMKRLRRKFGHSDWGSPLLKPKTNLRICDTCGHHYEAKHLCRNCYDRIMLETNEIRKAAEEQFSHGPEDKGIIVMYESEKDTTSDSNVTLNTKDNIFVEIPKPRPIWFSSNLLQKSTVGPNTEAKAVTAKGPKPIISSESS